MRCACTALFTLRTTKKPSHMVRVCESQYHFMRAPIIMLVRYWFFVHDQKTVMAWSLIRDPLRYVSVIWSLFYDLKLFPIKF